MKIIGFVALIPLVIIVLTVMVRVSNRALEIDLRDQRPGPQNPHPTASEPSRSRRR
jgi:hypothetical protein